jgi:antitoxin component YwqK of YwqJK toxin-antitoxin module
MQDKTNDINQIDTEGKHHGPWKEYHTNGQFWYKGEYVHGKPHGPWKEYRSDGRVWYKTTFDMGKRIGYYFYCYSYGRPIKQFYAN